MGGFKARAGFCAGALLAGVVTLGAGPIRAEDPKQAQSEPSTLMMEPPAPPPLRPDVSSPSRRLGTSRLVGFGSNRREGNWETGYAVPPTPPPDDDAPPSIENGSPKKIESRPSDTGGNATAGASEDSGADNAADVFESSDADPYPQWTFRAGAVILQRSKPKAYSLFYEELDEIHGANLLDAGDFRFGYEPGIDLSVIRDFDPTWGLELRYFGVDEWSATQQRQFEGGEYIFNSIDSTYTSKLFSTELNLRYRGEIVTWLAGFRYLEVNELLRSDVTYGGGGGGVVEDDTANHLYGVQVGAEAIICYLTPNLRLDGLAKVGMYYNRAHHGRSMEEDGDMWGPLPDGVGNQRGHEVSYVGELSATLVYQWSERIALRGGYQLMWVNGVALASEQGAQCETPEVGAVIDTDGEVFYHGALLAVEVVR